MRRSRRHRRRALFGLIALALTLAGVWGWQRWASRVGVYPESRLPRWDPEAIEAGENPVVEALIARHELDEPRARVVRLRTARHVTRWTNTRLQGWARSNNPDVDALLVAVERAEFRGELEMGLGHELAQQIERELRDARHGL